MTGGSVALTSNCGRVDGLAVSMRESVLSPVAVWVPRAHPSPEHRRPTEVWDWNATARRSGSGALAELNARAVQAEHERNRIAPPALTELRLQAAACRKSGMWTVGVGLPCYPADGRCQRWALREGGGHAMSIGSEGTTPPLLEKAAPSAAFPSNQRKSERPQTLLHQSSRDGPSTVQAQSLRACSIPFCDAPVQADVEVPVLSALSSQTRRAAFLTGLLDSLIFEG